MKYFHRNSPFVIILELYNNLMNKQITQQVSHLTCQKRKLKWVMNLVYVVLAAELPDPVQNESVGSLRELF